VAGPYDPFVAPARPENDRRPRRRRLVAAAVGGYLLGAFPSADLAAWAAGRGEVDLRRHGSGNPGALNARRLLGRRAGRAVLAADVGKAVAASVLGRRVAGDAGAHVGAVASVAGHCYPVWTGFRGGKGIATAIGQCVATMPLYAPLDVGLALGLGRVPGLPRPAWISVGTASLLWIGAGAVWWRRDLPNLWGPRPTSALPLANAATVAVIVPRALEILVRGQPDEFALAR
jgi:glycerol-3-phosphate acyltransferase PlsY